MTTHPEGQATAGHTPVKVWCALTTILTRFDQVATVIVPDGHRGIMLIRGDQPTLALPEPGEYEWSAEALERGADFVWPAALCIVDSRHVAAWLALPITAVDRMLDRCALAVGQRRPAMAEGGQP